MIISIHERWSCLCSQVYASQAVRAGTRRVRRWQPRLASALGGAAARSPVSVQTEGAARDMALHYQTRARQAAHRSVTCCLHLVLWRICFNNIQVEYTVAVNSQREWKEAARVAGLRRRRQSSRRRSPPMRSRAPSRPPPIRWVSGARSSTYWPPEMYSRAPASASNRFACWSLSQFTGYPLNHFNVSIILEYLVVCNRVRLLQYVRV